MNFSSNKVFELVFDKQFQNWVRKKLPLQEFCTHLDANTITEAALTIQLLDGYKINISESTINRNYQSVLDKILFD